MLSISNGVESLECPYWNWEKQFPPYGDTPVLGWQMGWTSELDI